MGSLKRHEGWLLIDNRFGPGVSAEFVKASGKDAPIVSEGQLFEAGTYTCPHCHTIIIMNPLRQRERNVCRKCMQVVCDKPGCNIECIPMEKVLDNLQEQAAQGSSILLLK